jgi:uncharacterized C2H2 Zn-finger protein
MSIRKAYSFIIFPGSRKRQIDTYGWGIDCPRIKKVFRVGAPATTGIYKAHKYTNNENITKIGRFLKQKLVLRLRVRQSYGNFRSIMPHWRRSFGWMISRFGDG